MARIWYWLVATLLLASACGTTGEETATQDTGTQTDPVSARAEGFWLLESYTIDGVQHDVEVGVNAASQPWIEIGEVVYADMGCNTTGREITRWTGDTLTVGGGHNTEMLCGREDERLMEVEDLLRDAMSNRPVKVEVDADTMVWRNGDTQLVFSSILAPPAPAPATSATILGTWLLDALHTADDYQDVNLGVNAAEHPWIEIDTGGISGNAGCNDFGTADYEFDGEWLTVREVFFTAQGCVGSEGADLMQIETIFQELFWADPPRIHVHSAGETMIWRDGSYELRFFRAAPPAPTPPEPPQSFGKLNCTPGVIMEESIDDSTRDAETILREEVPGVVRTEEDLEFTDPSPPGWFWLGYDIDDNLIAFIARGDIAPPRYQLFTCANN